RLVQGRLPPDVARLSDPAETRTTLALGGVAARLVGRYLGLRSRSEGCLLVLGWEGSRRTVRARRSAAAGELRAGGGVTLGTAVGRAWERERFSGPYLRDALLGMGALVETLETATTWADLEELYVALRVTLRVALTERDTPPLVLCHVSHVYATGASLYFTVVAARDEADPEGQWSAAKKAAGDVIAAHGATITHHHAVGLDHRAWMGAEVGDLGIGALWALKDRLDPAGILNPGKLLPPA
ncbi:MAG: FAD-linked oxidase C-terminal domain-containing protein, partial [Nocardioidaceae bacterium]